MSRQEGRIERSDAVSSTGNESTFVSAADSAAVSSTANNESSFIEADESEAPSAR